MRTICLAALVLLALELSSSAVMAAAPAGGTASGPARAGDKTTDKTANQPAPIYVGAYSVDHEFNIVTPECLDILRTKKILIGSRSWGLGLGAVMATVDKKYGINWVNVSGSGRVSPTEMILPGGLFDRPKVAQFTFFPGPKRFLCLDDFLRKDPWKFGNQIDGCLQLIYVCGEKNLDEQYFPVFDQWLKDFPKIKFAICTHPVSGSGKKADGTEAKEASDWNLYGQDYSDKVIRKYYGKVPIFDLQDIASTRPDGSICSFEYNGKTYRKMWPEYNSSGDLIHVNAPEARQRLPKGFLILLTKMFCADKIPQNLNTPKPAILK